MCLPSLAPRMEVICGTVTEKVTRASNSPTETTREVRHDNYTLKAALKVKTSRSKKDIREDNNRDRKMQKEPRCLKKEGIIQGMDNGLETGTLLLGT